MRTVLRVGTLVAALGVSLPTFAQGSFEPGATAGSDADTPSDEPAPSNDPSVDGATTGLALKDRVKAVSRKVFLKEGRFALSPFAGISTNDAFFRRWTVGARASYHLMDSFSLELGGAWNAFSEQLESVRIVGQELSAVPNVANLYGYADGGVTFSPIYGKVSLMSEWVIHFDGFVSGGVGGVFTSNQDLFHPAMQIGVGTRVFLNRWVEFRADLRDYVYPESRSGFSTIQNLLMLNFGVGFYFPFDFEYKYQAARISS